MIIDGVLVFFFVILSPKNVQVTRGQGAQAHPGEEPGVESVINFR